MTFKNNKKFKIDELIDILNKLKDTKKTTISFGTCNYDGEWFDFNVEEIDFEEDSDDVVIVFKENKEYKKRCA